MAQQQWVELELHTRDGERHQVSQCWLPWRWIRNIEAEIDDSSNTYFFFQEKIGIIRVGRRDVIFEGSQNFQNTGV